MVWCGVVCVDVDVGLSLGVHVGCFLSFALILGHVAIRDRFGRLRLALWWPPEHRPHVVQGDVTPTCLYVCVKGGVYVCVCVCVCVRADVSGRVGVLCVVCYVEAFI